MSDVIIMQHKTLRKASKNFHVLMDKDLWDCYSLGKMRMSKAGSEQQQM